VKEVRLGDLQSQRPCILDVPLRTMPVRNGEFPAKMAFQAAGWLQPLIYCNPGRKRGSRSGCLAASSILPNEMVITKVKIINFCMRGFFASAMAAERTFLLGMGAEATFLAATPKKSPFFLRPKKAKKVPQ
jgi:hypothetical protein